MSLIESALKKLQAAQGNSQAVVAHSAEDELAIRTPVRTSITVARKKKVSIDGPKYHISQPDLVRAGLLAPFDRGSAIAGEFRRIKRPLIVNATNREPGSDAPANVIMITSALPNAGKTFCSVNLAVSISLEREINVLLVDADVAKPNISREFGLVDAPGLIDLLLDDAHDIKDVLVRTDLNDIQILPAGRRHAQATELLASERMSKLVSELAARYSDRIIIVDSPPLLATSEAQALASQVGQIVLIVEAGETSHQQLAQTLETLDSSKAVNIVLNKSTRSWGRAGDYLGDYVYYGHTTDAS